MPKYKSDDLIGLRRGKFNPIIMSEMRPLLKRAINTEHQSLLLLAYITGLRPIEIRSLTKESFIISNNLIKVKIATAKGGVIRTIGIPAIKEYVLLKKYIQSLTFPKQYAFASFVKVKNARSKFLKLNNKSGIGRFYQDTFNPFSFYIFRHNIMTLLAEQGADFIDLLLFKGAQLPKSLFGSASYYIHHSAERAKRITRFLRKIIKEN